MNLFERERDEIEGVQERSLSFPIFGFFFCSFFSSKREVLSTKEDFC